MRCNPYGNPEALGWAVDSVAIAVALIGPAVFLSTALLNLARAAAGCEAEIPEGENEVPECNNRVYGIKPSSLLTIYSLVVGVAAATLLPLAGAVIDHTKYRRGVGRASALTMTILIFCQIFISETTWFAVAILQVVVTFFYAIHMLCVYAYLPELTEDPDTLIRWTANFAIVQYASTVLFLVVMVGLVAAAGLQDDEVAAARLSQSCVFAICATCFGYAWTKLFGSRPASQCVPDGSSLLTAGFRKIFKTMVHIRATNNALVWFLVALSLSEAALFSLSIIALTYMTDQLQFTAMENGIAILSLLVASIPGSALSMYFTRRYNPIRSLQFCLVLVTVNTAVAAVVLVGPGQQGAAYGFAAGWGFATGWKYPTERVIYCSIIPKNQEAELMGFYLFVGKALAWLPPLIFTAMNEAGVSMRAGIASLDLFFVGSFLVLFLCGDYVAAVAHAKDAVHSEDDESNSSEVGALDGLDQRTEKTENVLELPGTSITKNS